MTVKTSISLTDAQEAYARSLVERGVYPSLSAVLQQGLELLKTQVSLQDAELAALRALLDERAKGPFISIEEGREQVERMIERKRRELLGRRDAP